MTRPQPIPSEAPQTPAHPCAKHRKVLCVAAVLLLLLAGVAAVAGLRLHHMMFGPGVTLPEGASVPLYIEADETYPALYGRLTEAGYLRYPRMFDWMAGRMRYKDRVRTGRYMLSQGMSNRRLLQMLRAGEQAPVEVTFRPFRFAEQLAGAVTKPLQCDSAELVTLLRDETYLAGFGVTPATALTLFIPDTYQFMWNTSADGFVRRMFREYNRFWEGKREEAREKLGMTRTEVAILASIVEEETHRTEDRRMVARVYLNRLARHMPLQADPTVRYALGDFTIHRVLTEHLSIPSPYNTYYVNGLPPGPICIPSAESIDAVLYAPQHDYLYFCTAPDFESLNFARTLREHNRNAAAYQRELNRLKIWR
ncbi:MAG: endolytic transglycosylase MltG [Bacteroidales bacterium]|nr:endolytic transglycosylase MltG [Bacteroidales bacterium]